MVQPGVKPKYRYVLPPGSNVSAVDPNEVFKYLLGDKFDIYDTTHKHPELDVKPLDIKVQAVYSRDQLKMRFSPPAKAKKAIKDNAKATVDALIKAYKLNTKTKNNTLIDQIIKAQGYDPAEI